MALEDFQYLIKMVRQYGLGVVIEQLREVCLLQATTYLSGSNGPKDRQLGLEWEDAADELAHAFRTYCNISNL